MLGLLLEQDYEDKLNSAYTELNEWFHEMHDSDTKEELDAWNKKIGNALDHLERIQETGERMYPQKPEMHEKYSNSLKEATKHNAEIYAQKEHTVKNATVFQKRAGWPVAGLLLAGVGFALLVGFRSAFPPVEIVVDLMTIGYAGKEAYSKVKHWWRNKQEIKEAKEQVKQHKNAPANTLQHNNIPTNTPQNTQADLLEKKQQKLKKEITVVGRKLTFASIGLAVAVVGIIALTVAFPPAGLAALAAVATVCVLADAGFRVKDAMDASKKQAAIEDPKGKIASAVAGLDDFSKKCNEHLAVHLNKQSLEALEREVAKVAPKVEEARRESKEMSKKNEKKPEIKAQDEEESAPFLGEK